MSRDVFFFLSNSNRHSRARTLSLRCPFDRLRFVSSHLFYPLFRLCSLKNSYHSRKKEQTSSLHHKRFRKAEEGSNGREATRASWARRTLANLKRYACLLAGWLASWFVRPIGALVRVGNDFSKSVAAGVPKPPHFPLQGELGNDANVTSSPPAPPSRERCFFLLLYLPFHSIPCLFSIVWCSEKKNNTEIKTYASFLRPILECDLSRQKGKAPSPCLTFLVPFHADQSSNGLGGRKR